MKLYKTDDYHEDYGSCLFIHFYRDDKGNVLGEPPECEFLDCYLSDGFDEEYWTHFIKSDEFNTIFEQVDPERFPPKRQLNGYNGK